MAEIGDIGGSGLGGAGRWGSLSDRDNQVGEEATAIIDGNRLCLDPLRSG